MSKRPKIAFVLAAAALVWAVPAAGRPGRSRGGGREEVYLTNEEFKKLDRFEAHALEKADKIYREENYRQAGAEYETFLREHARSLAIPYVLLRKARCLHKDDKRNEAIQQYNEVLDYFPNAVEYAGAALYYQGLAHWENGDEDKAMKHWARMARDEEYRKHRLAAGAINRLADSLAAKGHAESAVTPTSPSCGSSTRRPASLPTAGRRTPRSSSRALSTGTTFAGRSSNTGASRRTKGS